MSSHQQTHTLRQDPYLPDPLVVDTPARLAALQRALDGVSRLAVDTESNSLYAYRGRVCLIQVSTDTRDFLVDPIRLKDKPSFGFLGTLFADPTVEKVLHAAEYDVMMLHHDFGFRFARVFDTMIAASVLGWQQVGLGSILMAHYGVKVDKRHQRANWGARPLSRALIRYAQMDTHYLLPLRDMMQTLLEAGGHVEEAREMFEAVCAARWNGSDFDPEGYWRINGARDLDRRQAAVLRELYHLREHIARQHDVPVFKVMGDQTLVDLARARPRSLDDMQQSGRLSTGQMQRYGGLILKAVESGLTADPPAVSRRQNGSPTAESTARRYEALHAWRKQRATQRGVSSEVIISKEALWELASTAPRNLAQLEALHSLGPWRIGEYGDEILRVIAEADGR
jgi:ribonuclease D